MAWDSRFFSRTHHLTLLISGLRGTYPPLQANGFYSQDALWRGVALRFKVGLTQRYKPGNYETAMASRNFGMVIPDAEDGLQDKIEVENITEIDEADERRERDDRTDDSGRFDNFSLSNSLESLLDQALLQLIQLRLKFGLGWAGAEMLLAAVESQQRLPEEILAIKARVCYPRIIHHMLLLILSPQEINGADDAEEEFACTNVLPPDPLIGRENSSEINLLLTAFCYLLRRLTVSRLCTVFSTYVITSTFLSVMQSVLPCVS
jgi:ubiquitin-conjugating enzyme E2 Q